MNTTETNIPFFKDDFRPEVPVVERQTINAVVWNPRTDEVLCLDWPKFDWKTFIIGGVEDGEQAQETAQREIAEETGYMNLELIADLGKFRSAYFATHKNENRIANTTGFLFKLVNDVQREVDTSELQHQFHWIQKDRVEEYVNLASQKYLWEQAVKHMQA